MRYLVNIYAGRVYCGNGAFDTFEECVDFLKKDGFCTRAIIVDSEENKKYTIKIEEA